ncbi:MAG TPA: hypothetical protein PKE69_01425 [Pyrinomonadaceae bacterium]|nr:hypothetical protein [Pyrinomonadaceae bacterium]
MKKYFSIFFIVFIFILIGFQQIFACSCMQTPNPPCRSYGNTPVIFDGIVTEFAPIENNQNGSQNRRAKFKIENIYKGNLKKEVEIFTGDGGSDCGFPFTVGERYLVYAYGDETYLSTSYCSRTELLEKAKEDLDYFAQLPSLKNEVTIYGSVKKYAFGYGDDEDFGLTKPLFNIPIRIKGQKSSVVRTDRQGNFKVSGFPAGTYSVELLLPKRLKVSIHSRTGEVDYLKIPNKGCAEVKYYIDFEGKISGRVLDENGKGVESIDVQLVSADYKFEGKNDTATMLEWDVSDENGNYSFDGIPPGRYFLGIGIGGAFDVFGEYGQIFYPNATKPENATVINITENKELINYNLLLPKRNN